MKPTYFAVLAISSFLTVGTVTTSSFIQPAQANPCAAAIDPCAAAIDPCAAAIDPCAAAIDPCAAAIDPCAAAIDPCAAAIDPCAGAVDPCAAAIDPCAGAVDPCAAAIDPCAGAVDPCAAAIDPCAGAVDPCAAAIDPCAGAVDPCAGATTAVTPRTGAFQNVSSSTSGTATIIEENGKWYLEFDETFSSDDGPDLLVLLHQDASPQSYADGTFVNLGFLQATTGRQRYEIPNGVSLEELKSAVIWCRQFDVTFGVAAL